MLLRHYNPTRFCWRQVKSHNIRGQALGYFIVQNAFSTPQKALANVYTQWRAHRPLNGYLNCLNRQPLLSSHARKCWRAVIRWLRENHDGDKRAWRVVASLPWQRSTKLHNRPCLLLSTHLIYTMVKKLEQHTTLLTTVFRRLLFWTSQSLGASHTIQTAYMQNVNWSLLHRPINNGVRTSYHVTVAHFLWLT